MASGECGAARPPSRGALEQVEDGGQLGGEEARGRSPRAPGYGGGGSLKQADVATAED